MSTIVGYCLFCSDSASPLSSSTSSEISTETKFKLNNHKIQFSWCLCYFIIIIPFSIRNQWRRRLSENLFISAVRWNKIACKHVEMKNQLVQRQISRLMRITYHLEQHNKLEGRNNTNTKVVKGEDTCTPLLFSKIILRWGCRTKLLIKFSKCGNCATVFRYFIAAILN